MKRLAKIYIEITNVCNLSCSFCPPDNRKKTFMTVADFSLILDRIRGKTGVLYFHVKGEPLMHEELDTFIGLAGEAGFKVILTTNGTLIEEKMPILMNKPNLERINISLQSLAQPKPGAQVDRTVQERLTGTILKTAKTLARNNRKANPKFLVSLRLWTKDNIGDTSACIRIIENTWNLEEGIIARELAEKNSLILEDGVALHTAETFVWPSLSGTDFGGNGYCLALRDQAAILVDGTVVPCCLDGEGNLPLGNIFFETWDKILSSDCAKNLYKGFSDRKITEPLCRRCGFRTRFNEGKKQ